MDNKDEVLKRMETESQMRLNEKYQEGGIKVAEKQAEANISASRDISVYAEKKFISERCKEIRSREYEEIALDACGKMIIIKKNALVDMGPGRVSNMTNPKLYFVRRHSNPDEYIYELKFNVKGEEKSIFLNPARIIERNYVLRKFSSQGVLIYGKAKALIPEILAYLVANRRETDEYTVPDCPGWFMALRGKMGFAKKEDLTWKRLFGLTR